MSESQIRLGKTVSHQLLHVLDKLQIFRVSFLSLPEFLNLGLKLFYFIFVHHCLLGYRLQKIDWIWDSKKSAHALDYCAVELELLFHLFH